MQPHHPAVGYVVALAAAALIGWFVFDGYLAPNPSAPARDLNATQKPLSVN